MRANIRISVPRVLFLLVTLPAVSLLLLSSPGSAQDTDGSSELEQAFQQKIDATSSRDLDKVVKLCEAAIKKGLDEGSLEQAQQLASSVLFQQADQLGAKDICNGRPGSSMACLPFTGAGQITESRKILSQDGRCVPVDCKAQRFAGR